MKTKFRWLQRIAIAFIATMPLGVLQAEDIDIFVGEQGGAGTPNVIFLLDNRSNWEGNGQKVIDSDTGLPTSTLAEAEIKAITGVLSGLIGEVNVGVVQYVSEPGQVSNDGAYVRFNLQLLDEEAYARLAETLADEWDGDAPDESNSQGIGYGNLAWDLYNYLAGLGQHDGGARTPASVADGDAYVQEWSEFKSPLGADSGCGKTYIIFISNPDQSGPRSDEGTGNALLTNSAALKQLYADLDDVDAVPDRLAGDDSGEALPLGEYVLVPKEDADGNPLPPVNLGSSAVCYSVKNNNDLAASIAQCTVDERAEGGLCSDVNDCGCVNVQTACSTPKNTSKFLVQQQDVELKLINEDYAIGAGYNLDDWAKFFADYGVPVSYTTENGDTITQRIQASFYTIDVYNANPSPDNTALLKSVADVGRGRYFQAGNTKALKEALESALSDILSVSSTFAAVTLPLSATNRAQQENQVFIGMFRPENTPRWFGNLKRYQVGLFDGVAELADKNADRAVNIQSGFADECAASYWGVDSGNLWKYLTNITPSPFSQCVGSLTSPWSDLPDGPFVEKGGVAQVTRRDVALRSIYTAKSGSLSAVDASDFGGDVTLFNYFKGAAVGVGEVAVPTGDEKDDTAGYAAYASARPSVHGDVIHSRPLPINYGATHGTVIYYGANDGLFRAISSNGPTTRDEAERGGVELWSMVAPEHLDRILRLYKNTPLVQYEGRPEVIELEDGSKVFYSPKDYFFDGSIGSLVNYNEDDEIDLAYIFPTMRRGGRMVYGLDVTDPENPALLWRKGCLADDPAETCDQLAGIGQTWSTPKAASLAGYADAPVVVFGGGYDACVDKDAADLDCADALGRKVYVVNAETGVALATFDTDAPVVADVAVLDMDFDGKAEYAYAVDVSGKIYRISFADKAAGDGYDGLEEADWRFDPIAEMDSASTKDRRFMNAPVVVPYGDAVYVTLGSGNRERPLKKNYPYAEEVQDRYYTFIDYPPSDDVLELDGDLMVDVTTEPACSADGIHPGGGKRGWFMDLPGRGEQVVNSSAVAGGDVFFNTYQPGGERVGMCVRPGIATGYRMSLFNGSACDRERSAEIPGGGMPIAPTISTLTVKDPDCVGDKCDVVVTICIGCRGLMPTEIEPNVNATRSKIYWNSDIDRQ